MDQERIVHTTRRAVEEVFGMMVGLPAAAGTSYTEETAPTESERLVTLIGVVGRWIGAGSISCSLDLACKLSSALLMEDMKSVNREVLDAMAEITNMIFGSVKTVLEGDLGPLGVSIPTVVFGRNFSTNSSGQQTWNVIPYEVEGERMDIKICLGPAGRGGKSAQAALHFRTRFK